MVSDFFLQNRSYQIERLCSGQNRKFEIPNRNVRGRLPQELVDFYDLIERICTVAAQGHSESEAVLSDNQRRDLQTFERKIVSLRFSSDDTVKQPAVQLIKSIFADTAYFSGLKPLPQYTDVFAYELLFPSWLNLLTATMLPQAINGRPRLEGKRQGSLFEFLGKVSSTSAASEEVLVGIMTFISSRFDAPLCEELLQRLTDLFTVRGSNIVEAIECIDLDSKDARQFASRLQDYLTVKHSMSQWPSESEHSIAYKRPLIRVLPKSILAVLSELHDSREDWSRFFKIANPLRHLILSQHLLTSEYIAVLDSHPQHLDKLLNMAIQVQGAEVRFLAPEGQICLANLVACEMREKAEPCFEQIQAFATSMAPKLAGFSESMLQYFSKQLITEPNNRMALLSACSSDQLRAKLADYLMQRAGKIDDDKRFLELLACVTVVSCAPEMPDAKSSLQAIDAVVSNRSIGNKEFSDLVGDLQANIENAVSYLAAPIMAAAGKSPRLASLYMTLNEIAHTYAATGKADNFSVIRAKYSALTNFSMD